MTKRARKPEKKQASTMESVGQTIAQLVLPMVAAVALTRRSVLELVHQLGFQALEALLAEDAAGIAGPKGKRNAARSVNHWGFTLGELVLGGRKVRVRKPRLRAAGGGAEVAVPAFDALAASDPLPDRVAEQIALGVSTRGYARSLEPVPPNIAARGTSKSAASRALVERTGAMLDDFTKRRLTDHYVALFIDGIEFAGRSVVVALGVAADGRKDPLGLWVGSTENAELCARLLEDLTTRGLRTDTKLLCVVDGGKGIRKAIRNAFGDMALVQRCQVHKMRNVRAMVSAPRESETMRQMRMAYAAKNPATALRLLKQLASWLERNGEESAAGSLREGMTETLTVYHLTQSITLRRTFATTNAIENLNGRLRRTTRNVTNWKNDAMVRRWVTLGITEAVRGFRRVKGHKDMPALVAALTVAKPAAEEAAA